MPLLQLRLASTARFLHRSEELSSSSEWEVGCVNVVEIYQLVHSNSAREVFQLQDNFLVESVVRS